MKKNLYYRTVIQRENKLKKFFLDLFLSMASYPRLAMEVFIRRNFGERYFTLASAITVGIILLLLPAVGDAISNSISRSMWQMGFGSYSRKEPNFWAKYATWYLYVAAYAYCSYLRWLEVLRNPSVFDFARFSKYSGDIHPRLRHFRFLGSKLNIRNVEIFIEPAPFFIAGLFLWIIGQPIGVLLVICSLIYCLSYAGAYRVGDNFVMDRIDEMITNEETFKAFVEEDPSNETRGVRFYSKKPNSKELREKVSDTFIEGDDNETLAT